MKALISLLVLGLLAFAASAEAQCRWVKRCSICAPVQECVDPYRYSRGGYGYNGGYGGSYGYGYNGGYGGVVVAPIYQPTVRTPGALQIILGAVLAPVDIVGRAIFGSETPVGPPVDAMGLPICNPADKACARQRGFKEGRSERFSDQAVAAEEDAYQRGLRGPDAPTLREEEVQ